MLKSIELRASRNMGIDHQQVQSLIAIDLVDCRNQHFFGINAHHLSQRQVHDCNRGLANQLFRLVILVNTAQNDAIFALPVIQRELQELLALLHGFARQNLHRTEIRLGSIPNFV